MVDISLKGVTTLRPTPQGTWVWVYNTNSGQVVGEGELAHLPPGHAARIRVLLPGAWVTHVPVTISAKSLRLVAQALPYALEEQLAEDIEQVQIAHGVRQADGSVAARVVQRERLAALLAELKAHDVTPDAVYSELDAIPAPVEGWVLLPLSPDEILVRHGAHEAMSLPADWLSTLIQPQDAVHWVDVAGLEHLVGQVVPASSSLTREPAPGGAWLWLHQHLREAQAVDFLGGKGRGTPWGDKLRPWAWPAGLAASLFVLQLGYMLVHTQQLKQQAQAMRGQIEQVARDAAPEVKRWVNPLVQLRQMAKTSGTAQEERGLLPLLAALSPVLEAQSAVKLGSVRYQAGVAKGQSGYVEVQLTAPNTAALEAVSAALKNSPGLHAELAGLRAEGERAEARLRIKERGA